MRPILKHRLVDGLGLAQMIAEVFRNPRIEDVVVATFYDVNGIDLDVAEMFDSRRSRFGAGAEWRVGIQCLCLQPDAPGLGLGDGDGARGPVPMFSRVCRWTTPVLQPLPSLLRR
jgi:hypothetical protein